MTDDNDFDDDKTPMEKALEAVEDIDGEIDPYHHLLQALRMINIGITEIERAVKKQHAKLFPKH